VLELTPKETVGVSSLQADMKDTAARAEIRINVFLYLIVPTY